jgi:hypothetical protein
VETVNYEESRAAIRDRFIVIATEARLRQRNANRSSTDLAKIQAAGNAAERLTIFATEVFAVEAHKLVDSYDKTFSPELKERFGSVSTILDKHIKPGEPGAESRRAILERAEEYARFSPHYHPVDEMDDNEEISDHLNGAYETKKVTHYLLERMGVPFRQKANLSPKQAALDYTADLETKFTAKSARELTDSLGHLHQVLDDHLRSGDPFCINVNVGDAVEIQRQRWPIADLPPETRDIGRLARSLLVEPRERALVRTERKQTDRAERLKQEIKEDPFFRTPSPDATASPTHTPSQLMDPTSRPASPANRGTSGNPEFTAAQLGVQQRWLDEGHGRQPDFDELDTGKSEEPPAGRVSPFQSPSPGNQGTKSLKRKRGGEQHNEDKSSDDNGSQTRPARRRRMTSDEQRPRPKSAPPLNRSREGGEPVDPGLTIPSGQSGHSDPRVPTATEQSSSQPREFDHATRSRERRSGSYGL